MRKRVSVLLILAVWMVASGCALARFLPVPHENIAVETRQPVDITLEVIQEQISTPTPDPLNIPILSTREISRESESPRYIIQVRYPQIEAATGGARIFNVYIEQIINQFVESFVSEIESYDYDEYLADFANGLTTDYRPTYIDANQISINLLQSVYYAGAAHPLPFSRAVNFDLRSGRIIDLDELFMDGVDYLPRISDYAMNDLREQGVLLWEEGALPSAENYESWNITMEGLLFTFDPYQVAPYAAGFQEVLVPYEVLQDLLREGGPVPPLSFE
jgi:hypothetical protein